MECKTTNLLYWNKDIELKNDSDNTYIFSKKEIIENTVLLIEHVFCDNSNEPSLQLITDTIRFSPDLYNSLYPRKEPWNLSSLYNPIVFEKIKCNAFKFTKEDLAKVYIGAYVTKSNHSQNFNAKAFIFDLQDKENFPLSYIAIVATKNIKSKEEIFIKYNDNVKFNDDSSSPEEKTSSLNQNITLSSESKTFCFDEIQKYQSTDAFRFCRSNQIGIYYGIFCYQDKIFFNDNFESYCEKINKENTIEYRRLWFESIYSKYI